MALNLDTTFKLKAKVEGARSVQDFKKQLTGLDKSSKMSKAQLGKMNIEINRMARAAGNTTKGLRNHIKALTLLRDRTEIGGKAYKRLGGQIDNLKRKLKGLDGQAASTGTKLASMLATVGVGRAIGGIVRGASNYQEEVKKTAAIEGGGANFSQIDESIRATAQVAAGTPQEVAELATSLARAGFDADQISGSLNGIVLGAEATQTAFSEMGSIVANNINAFGLEVEDTGALVDILVSSANNANQTVSDLGESLKYAAPVAKTFGLTVNDTAATVGLLAAAGIKGSEAGTALRGGLSRLQIAATGAEGRLLGVSRGSQLLTKGFKALSSDILDANGNLKPMDEVLIALKRDFEGVKDAGQKAEIAKAIFGQEQGSKFLALLGRTEEDITNMFTAVRNSRDVAERTRKAMASFGLTTKILGGNVQVVTNQIGSALIAVLNPLAQQLNNLLTIASRLPTPVKGIASAAAAAGLAATGLAVGIGSIKAIGAVELFKPILLSLKGMALGFLGAAKASVIFLATNPFGWAIIGVTLIIAFRKQLAEFAKNVAKFVGDFIESKKQIVDNIMGIGKAFVKMINEFIIKTLNQLSKIPLIGKIFGGYLGAYQKLGEIVVDVSDKASKTIKDAKKIIQKGVDKAGEVTNNVVTTVSEGASNILGGGKGVGVTDDDANKQNQVLEGMKNALDDYKQKVNDVAGNVKNVFSKAFKGMEDALVNFVMTGKLAFGDLAKSIIKDMARIFIQRTIMKPFTGFLDNILGKNANGNAYNNGKITKMAYGGVINSPTIFPMKNGLGLMGEAGPESVMPLKRGSDGKLGVISHGGGVGNIVVNVDASGSSAEGDQEQSQEFGELLGSVIRTTIIEEQRPGGLLN
tara:strand:+ start:10533 stop:13133 length:2601 start_codon:yes stop_codon:yes gene_type:complete